MRHIYEKLQTFVGPVAKRLAMAAVFAGALTAFTLNFDFFRIEAYFYDLRMRIKGSSPVDPRIHLLVIESEEQNSIATHMRVLEKIRRAKPAAIAYLNKFDASEIELQTKAAEDFVVAANAAEADGTRVYLGSDLDLGGEVLPPYPLSLLSHSPAVLHKDGTIFGEDKITRRALLEALGEPTLHLRLAHPQLTPDELRAKARESRGAYFFKPADSWHVLIRYPGRTDYFSETFPRLTFNEILSGADASQLAGKIVLVDTIRKDSLPDFVYTPYSRITYTNPKLLVHAAILNTLLRNEGIRIVPSRIDAAVTFVLTLILAFVTLNYSPSRGVSTVLIGGIALFLFSLLLFRVGYWLRLVHPLFSLFCTYYLIVPYRAILEYKKRWEVQQKHDLLLQVEEMKGNFLSLMSHDLKTPVARIQGLGELVLKQGSLSEEQTSEIRQILESTESLDKFISKILHLTRIESSEIKLNRRSKDINKILESCVSKLEFQAKSKNINVNMELDPLFPISVDAALIIQVFTNLIDNAIKYSPPGAAVQIRSREVENCVEVMVADRGSGLDADEMGQLFTKFFRGKDRAEDQIKGSGLGLYLSRYFIELHQGKILVESEKGSGSRFTVRLPIHAV